MKVSITVDLDDNDRTAINRFFGKPGPADRDSCKRWIAAAVVSELDELFPSFKTEGGKDEG